MWNSREEFLFYNQLRRNGLADFSLKLISTFLIIFFQQFLGFQNRFIIVGCNANKILEFFCANSKETAQLIVSIKTNQRKCLPSFKTWIAFKFLKSLLPFLRRRRNAKNWLTHTHTWNVEEINLASEIFSRKQISHSGSWLWIKNPQIIKLTKTNSQFLDPHLITIINN